jgi:hypothetical protein
MWDDHDSVLPFVDLNNKYIIIIVIFTKNKDSNELIAQVTT